MKLFLIALCVFLFALTIRLWNLNMMGRVWDEQSLLEKGYILTELIKKGDFSNSFWYKDGADHPPFAFYFFGVASYADLIKYDPNALSAFSPNSKGAPVFHYDVTYGRLVSVVVSSLAVLLVFLIGARYFSTFIGIVSSIILAIMPHFLGYSQLVELESWVMLSFTACVFCYLLYLETGKKFFLIFTGILTGLAIEIKQPNILLVIFYVTTFYAWKKITKKKTITLSHFVILGIITLLASFIVYPMPWLHLPAYINYTSETWLKNNGLIPELIFGRLMGARWFYYIIAFFVTTPLIILLLTFLGIKVSLQKKKNWIYSAVLIWFIVPFLMSFFHIRQHMVRYIIEFYAPLALLSAMGFEYLIKFFTKNKYIKYFMIVPLFAYLLFILLKITPYYFDYYNELVGGAKTVYDKHLFFLGWWGEGLKAPGMYIARRASKNASIGLALNPGNTLYKSGNLRYETFTPHHKYEFVVLNAYAVTRIGFDENVLKKDYKIVYTEKADGADLVYVYKHK